MINPLMGEASPLPQTTTRQGQIVSVGGDLQVNVGGVVLPARWADPLTVVAGDPVLVLLTSWPTGQSEATVLCRTANRPRAGRGTVTSVPVGSDTISVSTEEGSVEAYFVATYSPTIGDLVLLSWTASDATVIGEVGVIPAPPPPPAPPSAPPPPQAAGTSTFAAIDSATFNVGAGWNDRTFGSDVVQGPYGGRSSTGSWFYGTGPSSLAGRSIVGARIYLAPRRRMGDYNNAATFHLYAHNASSRPAGEPTRVVGPFDITLPRGYGGGWHNIPGNLVAVVIAGGGISIAGSPYAGVLGRNADAQSGALSLDWTT